MNLCVLWENSLGPSWLNNLMLSRKETIAGLVGSLVTMTSLDILSSVRFSSDTLIYQSGLTMYRDYIHHRFVTPF